MVVIKPFEFVWNRSSFPHCSLTLTLWGRLLLRRNKLTFFFLVSAKEIQITLLILKIQKASVLCMLTSE